MTKLNEIDLLIIPSTKTIQPGDHLTDEEKRQVLEDWHNDESAPTGQYWTTTVLHGTEKGATATTMKINRTI